MRDSDAFLRWQLIDRTDRERARDQDLFDVFSTGNSIRFPYLVWDYAEQKSAQQHSLALDGYDF
ncbi:hypothetical protein NC653_006886 [Populus alba x Populus x berolinensis]|uniref:Uncharacterized protein n=1 Tax=Populus alba x Populus x berolinensis TaxID=444605 RepID=A0AAD6RFI0_9ROSI|nr:hypothetical protein NC653_006886 [Populus alba x Populus x berolinensis]